ncbi:GyrI-like domain-containing protein [Pseudoalteromonas mariniglutinosa]|uniref:GyrI-like domain-containing protein n=2 Tax=Pseudoalteromonas mariniglutinosa TaxID=206042 RepID=UPI00384FA3C1
MDTVVMDNKPSKLSRTEKTVLTGLKIRTYNANEMNTDTAKIPSLWQQFAQQYGQNLTVTSQVYGVYTNYESDVTGEFDVYACMAQPNTTLDHTVNVTLNTGNYVVFSGKGEMPQTVIDVWGQVWQYFCNEDCQHVRAYDTDYEFYKSIDEVDVVISVK